VVYFLNQFSTLSSFLQTILIDSQTHQSINLIDDEEEDQEENESDISQLFPLSWDLLGNELSPKLKSYIIKVLVKI